MIGAAHTANLRGSQFTSFAKPRSVRGSYSKTRSVRGSYAMRGSHRTRFISTLAKNSRWRSPRA